LSPRSAVRRLGANDLFGPKCLLQEIDLIEAAQRDPSSASADEPESETDEGAAQGKIARPTRKAITDRKLSYATRDFRSKRPGSLAAFVAVNHPKSK